MMRVVQMTTGHRRHDSRVFWKECCSLAEYGHETILYTNDGDSSEVCDGVEICGVANSRHRRWSRFFLSPLRMLRAVKRTDANIYHFHDPEMLVTGLCLKLAGKTVVYDAHEHLPDQIKAKPWIPRFCRSVIATLVDKVELAAAKRMNAVIAATPAIGERFAPVVRTYVVNNYPILNEFQREPSAQFRSNKVCYVGTISDTRGITELIDAIALTDASLEIAGLFPEKFRSLLSSRPGWNQVVERGYCGRSEISDILYSSKVGLCVLHPTPAHLDSQPIKLYEYMAAGLPVIATGFPKWRALVEKHQCGICIDDHRDVQEIARAINFLLEHPSEAERMGRNGRKIVSERLNWRCEFETLLKCYSASTT